MFICNSHIQSSLKTSLLNVLFCFIILQVYAQEFEDGNVVFPRLSGEKNFVYKHTESANKRINNPNLLDDALDRQNFQDFKRGVGMFWLKLIDEDGEIVKEVTPGHGMGIINSTGSYYSFDENILYLLTGAHNTGLITVEDNPVGADFDVFLTLDYEFAKASEDVDYELDLEDDFGTENTSIYDAKKIV